MILFDVPESPCKTVALNLFELNGSNYLLVADYLSAFVQIAKLNNTSSASIVNNLKSIFARHGIPDFVVTVRSIRHKGSLHMLMLMYSLTVQAVQDNLESNGVSERAVKAIKGLLKKSEDQYETLLA